MRLFLALFLPISFFLVFVLRSLLVWRRTGQNPIVIERKGDVYGYIGVVFIGIELATVASIALFIASRAEWLGAIPALDVPMLQVAGAALLVGSTALAVVAQAHMGTSWRIGIDHHHDTPLVTGGLFRRSRNPIFLAMQVSLLGLFLALPTVATLVVLVLGHVVLNVQVRLEEDFLSRQHGERYEAYRRVVRRWI